MKRSTAIIDYLETRLAEAIDEIHDLNDIAARNTDAYQRVSEEASNLECLASNNRKLADQFRAEAQSATSTTIELKSRLVKAEAEITRLTPYEVIAHNWKDNCYRADARLNKAIEERDDALIRLTNAEKRATVNVDDYLRLTAKVEEQKKAIINLHKIIDKLNGDAYILRGQIRRTGLEPDVPETSMS